LSGCAHKNNASSGTETPLFNGSDLSGWRVSDFAGHGDVYVENGELRFGTGAGLTGVTWSGGPPATVNYQIDLDAMKVAGSDFFCGITFPVNEAFCSLIVGGWGGAVVGISSINGADASSNETTDYRRFETGQWYHVRLRVSESKIEVWIDEEQFVDLDYTGKTLSVRADINQSTPLGLSAWQTHTAMKNIVISRW
jgi:hypothetical protein